jgi:glutathione synthase/RimK-type ligase-like ATP-grasp enzyme
VQQWRCSTNQLEFNFTDGVEVFLCVCCHASTPNLNFQFSTSAEEGGTPYFKSSSQIRFQREQLSMQVLLRLVGLPV